MGQSQKNMTTIQMPGFDLGWEGPLQKWMAVVRCSVAKSCLTLHTPVECSTPGFCVPHHLLEFVKVHVHGIKNAIQPPHALSPSLLLSIFLASGSLSQSVGYLHQMAKLLKLQHQVLPMSTQHWFPLRMIGLISLLSKGLLRVYCSTTVRKHQAFSSLPFLWFSSHNCRWLLERP